jgi:hypothetical protein
MRPVGFEPYMTQFLVPIINRIWDLPMTYCKLMNIRINNDIRVAVLGREEAVKNEKEEDRTNKN